jgi:thioredoxin reductase (NADPH)
MDSTSVIYDVLILGAGPAGYTAGIYSARANLKTLCLEGWQPGGWLTTTTMVENFPGFKEGILGPQLMADMRAQAERFGVQFVQKDVIKVDFSKRPFIVYADDQEFKAKSVIIATGSKARRLGLPSESKLWGKGVASCATCDGFFYKGKVVAVVGGGDTAMEEANFLTKFATTVHLLNREGACKASAIMEKHARGNPKIQFHMNVGVEEVLGTQKVTGLRLKDLKTGKISELPVDGMFLAIGQIPSTDFLKGSGVALDQWGFVTLPTYTMTTVEGVFAAGDCADFRYKQGIVAAGAGARAAIDAKLWLEQNK